MIAAKKMLIYKILTGEEWREFERSGRFVGAPVDLADGFIHLSAEDQVAETAAKHFAGQDDLVLVAVEADALDDLRWEPSRGGALFPHLYAELRVDAVAWTRPMPWRGGEHEVPL